MESSELRVEFVPMANVRCAICREHLIKRGSVRFIDRSMIDYICINCLNRGLAVHEEAMARLK